MFHVGDKVAYPMHGAGVIEAIEEKEVLGKKREYYIMRLPLGDMRVMIPIHSEEQVGLRQIIDDAGVCRILEILKGESTKMSTNWNRRYRANMEKIKSGNIFAVAEVVRNLSMREKEKGLSTGERKMLESSKQILISEIILARNLKESDAAALVDSVLDQHAVQAQGAVS